MSDSAFFTDVSKLPWLSPTTVRFAFFAFSSVGLPSSAVAHEVRARARLAATASTFSVIQLQRRPVQRRQQLAGVAASRRREATAG